LDGHYSGASSRQAINQNLPAQNQTVADREKKRKLRAFLVAGKDARAPGSPLNKEQDGVTDPSK
jgi:hypothetical protein